MHLALKLLGLGAGLLMVYVVACYSFFTYFIYKLCEMIPDPVLPEDLAVLPETSLSTAPPQNSPSTGGIPLGQIFTKTALNHQFAKRNPNLDSVFEVLLKREY